MDIAPGRNVSIVITAAPRTAAARKTLTRLCSKDPAILKAKRQLKQHRPSWETWRRGGKMWHHQMQSESPCQLTPGAQYTVFASPDVIRDLRSVQRFVKVTAS